MDEDKFLQLRLQREEQRKAAAAAAEEDGTSYTQGRKAFFEALAAQREAVLALLAGDAPAAERCAAAQVEWLRMQVAVQNANVVLRLPAYEIKAADTTLQAALGDIDAARNAGKTAKKFAFSAKVKKTKFAAKEDMGDLGVAQDGAASSSRVADAEDESLKENIFREMPVGSVTHTPPLKAAFVRRSTGAVFFMAPVAGSCFISDCTDCTIYVSCHQMRIKSCVRCNVYVWCRSLPVIEDSVDMKFGGYEAWRGAATVADAAGAAAPIPGQTLAAWVAAVGDIADVARAQLSYKEVNDFSWLKQRKSPNWTVLEPSEWAVSDVPSVPAQHQ
jgi:hypothetical protein